MDKTIVDVRIGGDHFHFERDSNACVTTYFLNNVAVPVTLYLARMKHHREIALQRLYGRPQRPDDAAAADVTTRRQ
jgi:hypothetical protein